MAWNDHITVTFRGSSTNDPDDTSPDDYIEVEVGFLEVDSWPTLTPLITVDGTGTAYTKFAQREEIKLKSQKFAKSKDLGDSLGLMDGGRVRRMLHCFTRDFYWISAVWQNGSDHGRGYALRADYDATDLTSETSSDDFWRRNTPGVLPMRVVLQDTIRPEQVAGGVYRIAFTLLQATETVP